MVFRSNHVCLTVPTAALRDELNAVRHEVADRIAQLAGVNGILSVDVEVREVELKMRPVKLEDRVHHIVKRAPAFEELRKTFDLDVE